MKIKAVTFTGLKDNKPKPFDGTIQELLGDDIPVVASKEQAPCFSLTTYHPGKSRGNDGVATCTGAVLDFDKLTKEQTYEVIQTIGLLNVYAASYTTHSHNPKDPHGYRFRLVFPYATPVLPGQHKLILAELSRVFCDLNDQNALDVGRGWLMPSSKTPGNKVRYYLGEFLSTAFFNPPTQLTNSAKGSGRNSSLFRTGIAMKKQGKDDKEVRDKLTSINKKFTPPLDTRELDQLLRSLTRYKNNNKPAAPFKLLTDVQLMEDDLIQPEWIWDGVMATNSVSLLCAMSKVGKSTFIRNLVFSLIDGDPFLGRDTKQGTVLYIRLDETLEDVKSHFKNYDHIAEGKLKILEEIQTDKFIQRLDLTLQQEKPTLAIIDTIGRTGIIQELNSYTETTKSLGEIAALAERHNCHICLLHHTNKNILYTNTADISAVMGSTAFSAIAHTILFLTKKDETRILSSIQRRGTPFNNVTLDFDSTHQQYTLSSTLYHYEIEQIQKQIIEFLQSSTEPQTKLSIYTAIRKRKSNMLTAINKLINQNIITANKTSKSNTYQLNITNQTSSLLSLVKTTFEGAEIINITNNTKT